MTNTQNIILGAGPAGLQMARFLKERGEPYLVLDKGTCAGSFFERQPRHRKLLSINKRYTGYPDMESRLRYDWNSLLGAKGAPLFVDYTADYFPDASVLPRYLQDFAEFHDLQVDYGVTVTRIDRRQEQFYLETSLGKEYRCSRLFVGTGLTKENLPQIEGRELCDSYDSMPLDPALYTDKRVLIVGKGNSAFETAEALVETSRKIWVCGPRTVRLAWATHYVGDLRAVNNNFLDTYQLKAQNNILDGELKSVRRDESTGDLVATVYFESRKRSYEYRTDHVILCTGFRFDASLFSPSCRPRMRQCGRLPLMTSEWEAEGVPEMYFVGTLMQSRDYKKTMSGFIHGFRHNIEALDKILQIRDGAEWRSGTTLKLDDAQLAERLIHRLSTSAALLLQPGFLGDVVLVNQDDDELHYLEEVPVDYARDKLLDHCATAYVVTLEYRKEEQPMDPFAMPRGIEVGEDFYIHPIIRRYEYGRCVGKVFLSDDLDNDWRNDPEHLETLRLAFDAEFSGKHSTAHNQSFVAELSQAKDPRRVSGGA